MNVSCNKSSPDLTFSILFGFLHDFSFEMVFIRDDVAFPLGDSFLLTNPNSVGNL